MCIRDRLLCGDVMIIADDIILIDGYPYAFINSIKALVCADFHLGYEIVLADEEGYFIPQAQFDEILGELEKIVKEVKPRELIIVGDLKHKFGMRTRQETREVLQILEFINENFEKGVLVRGNHDNFVRGLFNKYENIDFVEKMYIRGDYLFTHGHLLDDEIVNASKKRIVVMGHEHPALLLYDDVGGKVKIPAFLYGETNFGNRLLVLPAVSPLMSGIEVNLISQNDFLSPFLRRFSKFEEFIPYGILRGKEILKFPKLGLWKDLMETTSIR